MLICFGDTPIYLRMFIYIAKNRNISEEINIKIRMIGKTQKTNSYKNIYQFSIKLHFFCSQHNSMTEMCCALFKYENVKKTS